MRKLVLFSFLFVCFSVISATAQETYTVERVVDGDTIHLTNGEKVRLIGIDAPESQPNAKAKRDAERSGKDIETINKLGEEATEFLKTILKEGDEVRIELDVQERDKYGRLLAYVYIPIGSAWNDDELACLVERHSGYEYVKRRGIKKDHQWHININATMIKSGHATLMTVPPNVKYVELFERLNNE